VQAVNTLALQPGGTATGQAACPGGKVVVGGGYNITFGQAAGLSVDGSYPADGGWTARFRNNGVAAANVTVSVYAICVFVSN
jgi:hypothetical protein